MQPVHARDWDRAEWGHPESADEAVISKARELIECGVLFVRHVYNRDDIPLPLRRVFHHRTQNVNGMIRLYDERRPGFRVCADAIVPISFGHDDSQLGPKSTHHSG